MSSGTQAAAHGGYTTVCAMPNLEPVPDSAENLAQELHAIRKVFGNRIPPFSSTKSLTGHSQGATGVQEAIYSLIMLMKGFIAGSANVETPDPAVGDMPLVTKARMAELKQVLSNSFGFGGTNACLVLKRWEAA